MLSCSDVTIEFIPPKDNKSDIKEISFLFTNQPACDVVRTLSVVEEKPLDVFLEEILRPHLIEICEYMHCNRQMSASLANHFVTEVNHRFEAFKRRIC